MGLVKLIGSMLALILFLQPASAAFILQLPLSLEPEHEIELPYSGLLEIDSTDANVWPADLNCVAVSFQGRLLPRQIEKYGSQNTQIYFPLEEDLLAEETSNDYKLLVGCSDAPSAQEEYERAVYSFDDFDDEKYSNNWVKIEEHECLPENSGSGGCTDISVEEKNEKIKLFAQARVDEYSEARAFLSFTSRSTLELKNNDLFFLEFKCKGQDAFKGSYVEAGLLANPEKKTSDYAFFKRNCINDLSKQYFAKRIDSEKIAVSQDGLDYDIEHQAQPFFLGFYVNSQSVRDKSQILYPHQILTISQLLVYPQVKAIPAQEFELVRGPPANLKLEILFPISSADGFLTVLASADDDGNYFARFSCDQNHWTEWFDGGRQTDLNFLDYCSAEEGPKTLFAEFKDNEELVAPEFASADFHYDLPPTFELTQSGANIELTFIDSWPGIDFNSIKVSASPLLDFNALTACQAIENGFACGLELAPGTPDYNILVETATLSGQAIHQNFALALDNAPPKITIEKPKDNLTTCHTAVAFKASVIDDSELREAKVRLDQKDWIELKESLEHKFNNLGLGAHAIKISVTDTAGNETQATVTFTIQECGGGGGGGSGSPGGGGGGSGGSGGAGRPWYLPPLPAAQSQEASQETMAEPTVEAFSSDLVETVQLVNLEAEEPVKEEPSAKEQIFMVEEQAVQAPPSQSEKQEAATEPFLPDWNAWLPFMIAGVLAAAGLMALIKWKKRPPKPTPKQRLKKLPRFQA